MNFPSRRDSMSTSYSITSHDFDDEEDNQDIDEMLQLLEMIHCSEFPNAEHFDSTSTDFKSIPSLTDTTFLSTSSYSPSALSRQVSSCSSIEQDDAEVHRRNTFHGTPERVSDYHVAFPDQPLPAQRSSSGSALNAFLSGHARRVSSSGSRQPRRCSSTPSFSVLENSNKSQPSPGSYKGKYRKPICRQSFTSFASLKTELDTSSIEQQKNNCVSQGIGSANLPDQDNLPRRRRSMHDEDEALARRLQQQFHEEATFTSSSFSHFEDEELALALQRQILHEEQLRKEQDSIDAAMARLIQLELMREEEQKKYDQDLQGMAMAMELNRRLSMEDVASEEFAADDTITLLQLEQDRIHREQKRLEEEQEILLTRINQEKAKARQLVRSVSSESANNGRANRYDRLLCDRR